MPPKIGHRLVFVDLPILYNHVKFTLTKTAWKQEGWVPALTEFVKRGGLSSRSVKLCNWKVVNHTWKLLFRVYRIILNLDIVIVDQKWIYSSLNLTKSSFFIFLAVYFNYTVWSSRIDVHYFDSTCDIKWQWCTDVFVEIINS